ncbi:MBL fold metallo-hydrolase [Taklimakanibacter deserti]|uniref:MBL fold metallo-hydrolase n=1 Tax=Taklimakanibacter deserti TaxID=2267839 RepID=UPI000E65E84B
MEVRFLGCGDAFGSGGRFHTCFHVSDDTGAFLIDCGATSLIALKKFAIDPNAIRAILISHLHGDHFWGLPFFLLDAQLVSRRTAPLVIAGPPGLKSRLATAMENGFPGAAALPWRFVEMEPGQRLSLAGLAVTPFLMRHACGAPPFALRIEAQGKVLCDSGDTEWVDELIEAAQGVDLFIAESYSFDEKIKFHLDFKTLASHLAEIGARRVILIHMSADMLCRVQETGCEAARDGLAVNI